MQSFHEKGVPSATFLIRLAAMVLAAFTPFGAALAQQGGAGNQLFNYPDTAINGLDSATMEKNAEECRNICAARSGCAGFDHAPKGNLCRIFLSIGSARAETGSTAGTRAMINGYRDPTNPPLSSRLEKLRQTDTSGEQLLALSRDAFAQNDRNIGMQAINLAMQRGNQNAKLEVARWYDPRTFATDRVPAVDANKSARSYFELALEGNQQANSLLTSLCREASNSGSAYARSFDSFLGSTYCEGTLSP